MLNSRRSLISPRACGAPVDGYRKPGFDATSCISGTTRPILVKFRTLAHLYTIRLETAPLEPSRCYEHGRYLASLFEAPSELSERRELSTPGGEAPHLQALFSRQPCRWNGHSTIHLDLLSNAWLGLVYERVLFPMILGPTQLQSVGHI